MNATAVARGTGPHPDRVAGSGARGQRLGMDDEADVDRDVSDPLVDTLHQLQIIRSGIDHILLVDGDVLPGVRRQEAGK